MTFVSIFVSLFFAGLGLAAIASLAHSLRGVMNTGRELAGQYRAVRTALVRLGGTVTPVSSRAQLRYPALQRSQSARPALRAAA